MSDSNPDARPEKNPPDTTVTPPGAAVPVPVPEPTLTNAGKPKHKGVEEGDASRGEVAIYAAGNIEGAIADNVPNLLQNILIVAAHMNPLLLGLIMGIKTLWDSVTDPIMAYISDNTKSRYGRRRPYILIGGVLRVLFLIAFVYFMPTGGHLTGNAVMEAQKDANSGASTAERNHETVVKTFEQIGEAPPEVQTKMLGVLDGSLATQNFLAKAVAIFTPEKPAGTLAESQGALTDLQKSLPVLEQDLNSRREKLAAYQASLADIKQQPGMSAENPEFLKARGLVENAQDLANKADALLKRSIAAQAKAIASIAGTRLILDTHGRVTEQPALTTPEEAQAYSDQRIRELGLEPIDLFSITPKPAPTRGPKKSAWSSITDGLSAFTDYRNTAQRGLVIYVLVGILIFTLLTTINSVPYYALGIELSPSYNGRTQVVVYRSVMNKIAGLFAPWVPVVCFSLWFTNAIDGLVWIAVFAGIIGIPSTVLMFFKTRERTERTLKARAPLLRSMWEIGKNPHFLRILFLYVFIGLTNGIFAQLGFFLNVYWVLGSALAGASLGAGISMLAWGLGFITLPLISWGCRRFEKHRLLTFAVIWMAIGTSLKWWAMNPEHPEFQFVLPFFFSIGIGSVYTVLPTMMADVTDVDELNHGVRREAMFGAVMAFLMKMIGTLTPVLAGAVLVLSGFDPSLEYHQAPGTIHSMRLMYSIIPACMLLLALVALFKYPLNRERVTEIKAALKKRHADERAAEA